jgi:hypothetical protein
VQELETTRSVSIPVAIAIAITIAGAVAITVASAVAVVRRQAVRMTIRWYTVRVCMTVAVAIRIRGTCQCCDRLYIVHDRPHSTALLQLFISVTVSK